MHKVRWNWTFLNLDRILELKNFCQQNETIKSLKIPETVWKKIENLRDALKPIFELTLALQASNLTIPDMVFKWHSKKLVLKTLQTTYSSKLLKSIENREHQIFSKPIIIASMFLDKRFSDILSNDEIGIAKGVINQIQKRLESLTSENPGSALTSSEAVDNEYPMDEEAAMVERMLGQLTKETEETEPIDGGTGDALAVELRRFQDLKRLRADTNILDFWNKQKFDFPLLSEIALTVLSIPVTEVDVERLFSHLTFIHSKLRNCLSDKLISDILFLRMSSKQNFDVSDYDENC